MLDVTSALLFVVILLVTYLFLQARKPSGMPPGPKGYPLIGNLNLIFRNRNFHCTLTDLEQKYGAIFSLQLASFPVVVLSDLDTIKEALIGQADNFSDRPVDLTLFKIVGRVNKGILFQNGETWKLLRRMAISTMRDFGVGKSSLESKIIQEAQCLSEAIRKEACGKPFQLKHLLNRSVTNIICSILFGDRFEYEDLEYIQLLKDIESIFKGSGFQNLFIFLSAVTFPLMPLLQPQVLRNIAASVKIRKYIMRRINEHRNTFDANNIRDFVDVYLEAEKKQLETNEKSDVYSDGQIFHLIMDFLFAGAETTSTTLLWAFYFLIKYPDVQQKCRSEINNVLGARALCHKDKVKMPYMDATIHEIQRCGSIAALSVMHQNVRETTLHGYRIPAKSLVFINQYSVSMNPKYFNEPEKFKPERFLDENGAVKKLDAWIPFGIGKRSCAGENLAKMELFLFLTTLLQRFEFSSPNPDELPSMMDTNLGITLTPKDYDIVVRQI